MLVLSRKKGESLIIGDDIEITILDVDSDNIRIGIKAPRSIEILRKELYASIKEANEESARIPFEIASLKKIKSRKKEE